ncbi:HIT family protein [Candidatus Woesearchaeota archaeon]|nr:HIT family protein [Candidatus Woesearchaeota archaeon]
MNKCVFCSIVSGEKEDFVIWENEKFMALLEIEPAKPGHCMLIPRQHIDYFFDLDDNLYAEMFTTAKKLAERLKVAMNVKRIGMAVVGFSVPHAHLHLIPLNKENELFPPSLFTKANLEELRMMQERIKAQLKDI